MMRSVSEIENKLRWLEHQKESLWWDIADFDPDSDEYWDIHEEIDFLETEITDLEIELEKAEEQE